MMPMSGAALHLSNRCLCVASADKHLINHSTLKFFFYLKENEIFKFSEQRGKGTE